MPPNQVKEQQEQQQQQQQQQDQRMAAMHKLQNDYNATVLHDLNSNNDRSMSSEGPRFMEATTPMMADEAHDVLTHHRRSNSHSNSHSNINVNNNSNINSAIDKVLHEQKPHLERHSLDPSDLASLDLVNVGDTTSAGASGNASNNNNNTAMPLWKDHLCRLLYNRSQERLAITTAYTQMLQTTTTSAQHQQQHQHPFTDQAEEAGHPQEFLVISGPGGSGKTTLAKTLQPNVEQDNGFFLIGKFDQLERPEPFRAFVAAFTRYTRLILQRDHDQHQQQQQQQQQPQQQQQQQESIKARTKRMICEAVGSDLGVLTAIIPALQQIVGTDFPAPPNSQEHAGCRFIYCMRTFMRAICSPQHPIVLVFDDLQYADACSLKLIRNLIVDPTIRGLIVIGTCLNTISSQSRLSTFLRALEDQENAQIRNITLTLTQDVTSMLAETFNLPNQECQELSVIVCDQTKGNLFYMVEFVRYLAEEGLLKFSMGRWMWNIDEIRISLESNKVGDFLQDKMNRLPLHVQDTIRVASCLGATIDKVLLDLIFGQDQAANILTATDKGVLIFQMETGDFRFATDAIQATAYNLIPEQERELFHVELGRSLLKLADKQLLEDKLYSILSQFRIGAKFIQDHNERQAIAMICLHAGKTAARSSAFHTASTYLDFGISLLPERKWVGTYKDLSLAMYNAAAEVQACLANTDRLTELLDVVISSRELTDCEKLGANCTKIYSLGQRDKQNEAIDMGVKVLKCMGETFPSRQCNAFLMKEARGVERLLKGKSDEDILNLPIISDVKLQMAMRILNIITLDAMCARPKFAPYVALKMMSITLRHGLSEHASSAFVTYGVLLLNVTKDVDRAFRFGQLGLKLLEKFKLDEYLPRVYAAFFGVIYPWKRPIQDTIAPLYQGHKVGLLTGDLEFAALNANVYCFAKMHGGPPVREIYDCTVHLTKWMKAHKQYAAIKFCRPNQIFLQILMGDLQNPLEVDHFEEVLNADDSKARGTIVESGISCYKVVIYYMFADFNAALRSLVKLQVGEVVDFGVVVQWTYEALTRLSLARQGIDKRKNLKKVRRTIKQFKIFSSKCPHNFSEKLFLIQGELASVLGKADKAFEKLTCAAALAASYNFLCFEALAYERLGWHLVRQPLPDIQIARSYFDKACDRYDKWQAFAKAKHLREEIASVFDVSIHIPL